MELERSVLEGGFDVAVEGTVKCERLDFCRGHFDVDQDICFLDEQWPLSPVGEDGAHLVAEGHPRVADVCDMDEEHLLAGLDRQSVQ